VLFIRISKSVAEMENIENGKPRENLTKNHSESLRFAMKPGQEKMKFDEFISGLLVR
jgi:hypothetical protein